MSRKPTINKKEKKQYLPPDEFNTDYEFYRGFAGKTKQWVRIALDKKRKHNSDKKILYFNIMLFRKFGNEWQWIVEFDTFHKEKKYIHGHRRIGLTSEKVDIQEVPRFKNFKEGLEWVFNHLTKNWHKYVTMCLAEFKKGDYKQ